MAVFAGNDHGFQVVVDVIPRILVESILVGMIVAVWDSIHPVSLANALGGRAGWLRACAEASEGPGPVFREVVATSPACLCKILHLSSWAVSSNFTRQNPIKLFTCRILVRAAPLVLTIFKSCGTALAIGVIRDALISTAPIGVVIAAVHGSALASEEVENQQGTGLDPKYPLCNCGVMAFCLCVCPLGCPKNTPFLNFASSVESLVRMGVQRPQNFFQRYRPINDTWPLIFSIEGDIQGGIPIIGAIFNGFQNS